MDEPPPRQEQLRRLKNTVMGASHRLHQMAQSGEWDRGAVAELAAITRELDQAVGRLERLLAVLRRDG
jgi:hypothetical protein